MGIPLRAKARAEGRGESKWVLKVLLGGRWRGEGSFYSLGLKGSVNRLNTSETEETVPCIYGYLNTSEQGAEETVRTHKREQVGGWWVEQEHSAGLAA